MFASSHMNKDELPGSSRTIISHAPLSLEGQSESVNDDSEVTSHLSAVEHKFNAVKNCTEKEPLVSDLKWSIFAAACFSHRYETCMDPYPPYLSITDDKFIEEVMENIDKCPAICLLDIFRARDVSSCSVNLLYWLFTGLDEVRITHVPNTKLSDLIRSGLVCGNVQEPHFLFHVVNKSHSSREHRWQRTLRGRKTFFAFHGNSLDAFHSILYRGFRHFMEANNNSMIVTNSLEIGLQQSPAGYGLGGSIIGSRLHCVALCEVVEHQDVRMRTVDDVLKVYHVMDGDLACLRYLLVYKAEPPKITINALPPYNDLIFRFKFGILVLVYLILVSYIWLTHS